MDMEPEEILPGINPINRGVTITGGEPFLQAGALIPLVTEIKKLGLDVWVYSGFTLEELRKRGPDAFELLEIIDVLVDGRFEIDKKCPDKWIGSSNQRIIHMKERGQ
jgi:anaerobic ribonucleoside-triphosphate reductase activating protein